MPRRKITIIGAGNVGATTAQLVATKELGDVVLIDVLEGTPQGKALDLQQAGPIEGYSGNVIGTNAYLDTAGSDVVVITAGMARKPGMSRDDLLRFNYDIVKNVTEQSIEYSPNACVIVVTNPVDPMTYVAWQSSGLPANRVLGMAGVLDTTRMRTLLAQEIGVSTQDITAFVLGGHGDSMVPLVRYSYAGGIPVEQLVSKERLDAIVARTRNGGGEIVSLLKTGSAYYAPAAAITEMVEAIIRDKKRILPTIAYLDGQYGESGVYVGVPAILGENGVERILEIKMDEAEQAAFACSIGNVRELMRVLPEPQYAR